MMINSDDMVSVTDANTRGVSWLVNTAAGGRTVVVMRNNKPAAVVTNPDYIDRLQRLDDIEDDLRLWAAALVRMATDSGARHRLEDVAVEFGVDLDAE